MIHAGLARRAFRRGARKTCIFRAATQAPGQLNATPQTTFQNTLIQFVQISGITEKEKFSAAGAYDDVEQIISFEAQPATGRPELSQGITLEGDRINTGGVIINGNLQGGTDHQIIDKTLVDVYGFQKLRLYVKAVA